MELFFHSKDPIFDYKNLFYQTNNCLFVLYKNLEYETISTSNLSSFKKSYLEDHSLIFYPEKIESLLDYINTHSSEILAVLCPSNFSLFLKDISNINNIILFYTLENKSFLHTHSYQKNPYTSVFFSYKNNILREKTTSLLYNTAFSKIGYMCRFNSLDNYKKHFTILNSNNLFDAKKLKLLSSFKNLLWINNYGEEVPISVLKTLNFIRNSAGSKTNIVIIDKPDLEKDKAIDVLLRNNCCAYLSVDDFSSTSFLDSEIISCTCPLIKVTIEDILCNNSLYLAKENIQDIENQIELLRSNLSTSFFDKIKKAKKYISNLLKISEISNILTLEALAGVVKKDIDELILNNSLSYISNSKELYQFVRNFNNW